MRKMSALVSDPGEEDHWPWYPHTCFHLHVVPHSLQGSGSPALFCAACIAGHFCSVENPTFPFCCHLAPCSRKSPPPRHDSFLSAVVCWLPPWPPWPSVFRLFQLVCKLNCSFYFWSGLMTSLSRASWKCCLSAGYLAFQCQHTA